MSLCRLSLVKGCVISGNSDFGKSGTGSPAGIYRDLAGDIVKIDS